MAVGVYANTLGYGAAWDDTRFVFQSGASGGVSAIPSLLTRPFLDDVPPARAPYRPVTAASYALDWSLSDGQAAAFHTTNVVLHATVTLLVAALLLSVGAPWTGALVGGVVFAVHPVHVEAVANLAGRGELLAALFLLTAALIFRRRWRAAGRIGPGATLLICLLYALGMGSKESAIMLPALLLLLTLLPGGSRRKNDVARLRRSWPVWGGLVLVAVGYLLLRARVLGTYTTYDVAPFILGLPGWLRATTAVANWGEYVRLLLWPMDLVVDYGPAVILPASPADLRFWTGLVSGGGILALAVALRRSLPLFTAGVAWFALAILPVTNLFVPIAQWLAERFFYLPSVGLSLAAASLVPLLRTSRRGGLLGVAAVLWLLLLAGRTWTRNRSWQDTDTVVRTLISEHPEAFRAQWILARMLLEEGRTEEGLAALDRAIALSPNAMELRLERAEWLLRSGHLEEARVALEALPAGHHAKREALLARVYAQEGDTGAARLLLSGALERFPRNTELAALADSLGGS